MSDDLLKRIVDYVSERPYRSSDEIHRGVAPDVAFDAFRETLAHACQKGHLDRIGAGLYAVNGGFPEEIEDFLLVRLASDLRRVEDKLDALAAVVLRGGGAGGR